MDNQYKIKSNRESGDGRYDIGLFPREDRYPGILMELKWKKNLSADELSELADEALAQIGKKRYDVEMKENGTQDILKFGIVFYGKKVSVKIQGCRAACDDQRQHQHQRQHTHDALFHSIPLQMFQSTCGYCIRKSRNCKELLRICYKLNFSSNSIGWAISTFAPLSSSSCAVRKPHSTPTGFMPALHAQTDNYL